MDWGRQGGGEVGVGTGIAEGITEEARSGDAELRGLRQRKGFWVRSTASATTQPGRTLQARLRALSGAQAHPRVPCTATRAPQARTPL